MYCTKCGSQYPDQMPNCPNCGNPNQRAYNAAQPGQQYNPSFNQGFGQPYGNSNGLGAKIKRMGAKQWDLAAAIACGLLTLLWCMPLIGVKTAGIAGYFTLYTVYHETMFIPIIMILMLIAGLVLLILPQFVKNNTLLKSAAIFGIVVAAAAILALLFVWTMTTGLRNVAGYSASAFPGIGYIAALLSAGCVLAFSIMAIVKAPKASAYGYNQPYQNQNYRY